MAAKLTPFFVSNSIHAAEFLKNSFGVERIKISVVTNGILLDKPAHDRSWWRNRLGVRERDFIGCMVASIGFYKDHSTAVRAWHIVADELARHGRRAILAFAGRNYGNENQLKMLIENLHLSKHVLMLGELDDVAGLLAACDIGVHCTKHEGCPNAVLEEMAAGLAVVGSDVPGIREALGEDGASFLSADGDAEGIAKHIISLANDLVLCRNVGINNKQRINSNFTLDMMCRNYTKVIFKCLHKGKAC
jgi:glycosyltransferase involved in cell wall biosynthesis